MNIHVKQVRIAVEGLYFTDQDGIGGFIDFVACHKSYRASKTLRERIAYLCRFGRTPYEIGWRDNGLMFGKPPTIGFYGTPEINLIFATIEDYYATRNTIMDQGWCLFDIT